MFDLRLRGWFPTPAEYLIPSKDTPRQKQYLYLADIHIHYNDYTVIKSPLEEFIEAVAAAGLENRVRYLNHGDTYTFEVPTSR